MDAALLSDYERDGYAVSRGLFTTDEVSALRDHYMALRVEGEYPGDGLWLYSH